MSDYDLDDWLDDLDDLATVSQLLILSGLGIAAATALATTASVVAARAAWRAIRRPR